MFDVNQTTFAQALLDPARPLPQGITSAGGTADPARFAIYRNNIYVGLTNALAKRFPVVQRLVGEAFFAGMARAYASLERPASPLMFEYGDGFPDFIVAFEPARGLAYLADVARLEAGWTRAYHAADLRSLGLPDLTAIASPKLAEMRFVAHPSLSLVSSTHPVGSIWAAHQSEALEPPRAWRPETVLVARPAMDVCVHILPAKDAAFAEALIKGETLAVAAKRATAESSDFDFGAALVGLVSLGVFGAITHGDDPT